MRRAIDEFAVPHRFADSRRTTHWHRLALWPPLGAPRRFAHRRGLVSLGKGHGAKRSGRAVVPEFQAKIPDPLGKNLPKFLPTRGMGAPAVRILFPVFIR